MKEKLVFVTNDDGYNSRGIQALLEVARKFGRVVAIAPETPQSGMSQAITINNPLFLREVSKGDGVEVYAFSGTPVDCVKIAFDYFLKGRKVDLALSGINHGSNSAANILYSGTMGGARAVSTVVLPSGFRWTITVWRRISKPRRFTASASCVRWSRPIPPRRSV